MSTSANSSVAVVSCTFISLSRHYHVMKVTTEMILMMILMMESYLGDGSVLLLLLLLRWGD